MVYKAPSVPTNKHFTAIPQTKFPMGYVSTLSASRLPKEALSKMQNAWLEQDSVPRPRPGFFNYGVQASNTILGIAPFTKIVSGQPQYWDISMQSNGTNAFVYTRKDGAAWTQVDSTAFDKSSSVLFEQASIWVGSVEQRRVYITNGVQRLAYYDVTTNTIISLSPLPSMGTVTLTPTGLTGSTINQYYTVTAYKNGAGETAGATAVFQAISTSRYLWTSSMSMSVSWSTVTGADGYNVYTGTDSSHMYYIGSTTSTSFNDTGNTNFPLNTWKLFPSADSTGGPIAKKVVNYNNQLYLIGDTTNPQRVWYSGSGSNLGMFASNQTGTGGGVVDVDFGGYTIPSDVFGFYTGQGQTYPSVLTYGPGGRGKLYHLQNSSTTIGSQTFNQLLPVQSSSQDGSPSNMGTIIYNNKAYYCTGTTFKSTGIEPQVINILATKTVANQIIPDLSRLTQTAVSGICGLEFQGRLFYALPVDGSTTNNVIWILDESRDGLWCLEWKVAASRMWLSQDNSGNIHFCILSGNTVMELDYNRQQPPHIDNNQPFTTILSGGKMIFGESGSELFSSYYTYFKFLQPAGTINTAIDYVDQSGIGQSVPQSLVEQSTNPYSRIGWDSMTWSNVNPTSPLSWSGKIKSIPFTAPPFDVLPVEVSDIVNQQGWTITTNTAGTDYLLSSVNTTGYTIPALYYGQ